MENPLEGLGAPALEVHSALVVQDGEIIAKIDSDQPVTAELLAATDYAGMEIMEIPTEGVEYEAGTKLAEYTSDGKLRPLIDRVLEGLCDPPPGYELVDGELVQAAAPVEEAPTSIAERLAELDAVKAQAAAADELISILLGGEIK